MPETRDSYMFLHRIWRRLPESGRRFLFREAMPLLAPRPDRQPTARAPISMLAPFRSSTGIGWGARTNARILQDEGFDIHCHDISDLLMARDLPDNAFPTENATPETGAGLLLVHANPGHIPYAFMRLGGRSVADKYVIGYSVWETGELPPDWRRNLRFVHEVWCPSTFSAEAFRGATGKPVHMVPHCIDPPGGIGPDRRRYGVSDDAFAVLTAIHLGSGLTRKNPLAAIEAFRSAFRDGENAILLMKVSQADFYPERLREIEHAMQGAPNLRLIHDTLTDRDYWKLLHGVDAVLSLHRSEGFGLIPAQGMSIGKLAIATGWSGNMDYMSAENSLPVEYSLVPVEDREGNYPTVEQSWADPDIDHAVVLLRRAASDQELRRRLGAAAVRTVRKKLGPDAVARIIRTRLADLGITPEVNTKRM